MDLGRSSGLHFPLAVAACCGFDGAIFIALLFADARLRSLFPISI
jgi:hypothetical protein